MPLPISNPYHSSDAPRVKVSSMVSAYDQALLKRLFPYSQGLQDVIVATLYHDLCQRLRHALQLPDDSYSPPESAVTFYNEHPSWTLLRGLLGGSAGQSAHGAIGARDDTGAASSIHQGVQPETAVSGSQTDEPLARSDSLGSEKGEEDQEGQRVAGDGPVESTEQGLAGLLSLLKKLKD